MLFLGKTASKYYNKVRLARMLVFEVCLSCGNRKGLYIYLLVVVVVFLCCKAGKDSATCVAADLAICSPTQGRCFLANVAMFPRLQEAFLENLMFKPYLCTT